MGSCGGSSGDAFRHFRLVSAACLALCLLLASCPPCEGRKLLAPDEQQGGKAMHFERDLVLRVPPAPSTGNGGGSVVVVEESAVVPGRFSASDRAARLMRSVPSPGVGH